VVADYDDFVWDGAVDDADYVPEWSDDVFLLVVEIEGQVGRANVVADAFVG
jgi:hypothetical protein